MPTTIVTKGFLEVWKDDVFVSRHSVETKAIEAALEHAEVHGDGDYELRFPRKILSKLTRTIVVDTTAPTAPSSLTATAAGQTTINLAWGAAYDVNGIARYDVLRGGSLVNFTNGATLSYSDTSVAPGTAYSYTVRARDQAGNISLDSNLASATTDPAYTAPFWLIADVAGVDQVIPGTFTPGSSVPLTAYYSAGDGTPYFTVQSATNSLGQSVTVTIDSATGAITAPATADTYTVSVGISDSAAEADWLARSTGTGVVAAYDFSAAPANGGTWQFGSLAPGITCMNWNEAYNSLDTTIAPPGSAASVKFSLPQGTGERSDSWLISIDEYAQQFGAGDTFYVQWRQRMNPTYATFMFTDTNASYTTFKHIIISEGMQDPMPYVPVRTYSGYEGTGTDTGYGNPIINTIRDVRFCSENQIVMVGRLQVDAGIKYPRMYHGCSFYMPFYTYNSGTGKYTDRNEGDESTPTACAYTGLGVMTNPATCFSYVPDEWMTFMIKVVCGQEGSASSSIGGGVQSGFINSTVEYYGAYEGASAFTLLHRKTGIVLRRGNSPGDAGWSPLQKFGVFGWMTFMTLKDSTQAHPTAETWVSQVVISRNEIPVPLA